MALLLLEAWYGVDMITGEPVEPGGKLLHWHLQHIEQHNVAEIHTSLQVKAEGKSGDTAKQQAN
eukprot:15407355-Alexandrium_andersonii.AAC.1